MQPLDAPAFGFLFDQRQHQAAQANTSAVGEQDERTQQPVRSFALIAPLPAKTIGFDREEAPPRPTKTANRQPAPRQEEANPADTVAVVGRRV